MSLRRILFCFASGLLLVATSSCKSEPEGAELSLFNGKDLTGWKVTECKTAIKDGGVLLLESGEGWVRTDHEYADFVLWWECKNLKSEAYDSGVHFRAELPAAGAHWPKKFQVNLKQGEEGNVKPLNAASKGLYKPGEWNSFKLTVVGTTAELEINGKPAWKAEGVDAPKGYIGLQSEVTLGGQFEFRNIKIKELGKKLAFNGRDFEGWEGAGQPASQCWTVENGELVCTGTKGPWLRSLEEYADFNLRFEYLLDDGGNSGVFVRVPEDGNHHGPKSGLEIQLLDDYAEKHSKLKPYQYSASVYDIVGAEPKVARKPGMWNTIEINCRADRYVITHNGVVVVDADEAKFPLLSQRRRSGYIGLQNHSSHVAFRNIRIGPPM